MLPILSNHRYLGLPYICVLLHHCETSKNYYIGGLLWKENDGVEAMGSMQCNLFSIPVSQRPKSPHTISMFNVFQIDLL